MRIFICFIKKDIMFDFLWYFDVYLHYCYYLQYSDYWPHLYCYIHNMSAFFALRATVQKYLIWFDMIWFVKRSISWVDGDIRFISPKHLHGSVYKVFSWKVLLSQIILRLWVLSQQQVRLTKNTYYNLTLVAGHG